MAICQNIGCIHFPVKTFWVTDILSLESTTMVVYIRKHQIDVPYIKRGSIYLTMVVSVLLYNNEISLHTNCRVCTYRSVVCIWPWLSISGLRKPQTFGPVWAALLWQRRATLLSFLFLDMLQFYNPAECYNESHHDLKLLFWQKFLSKPSQTFCELIVNINNTFDSAKTEVLWLHTLDHDRLVWTNGQN